MDLTRFQTNHQQCAQYKLPFVWEMHVQAISLNHVDSEYEPIATK